MGKPIDLIAGLGNPDPEHLQTRHNAGFWFVDALARMHGAAFSMNKKLQGELAEVSIAGRRVRLLKPQTYMNLSGQSVAAAVNYFRLEADGVLVVHDELDFPPGKAQLKFDGGHAGHNGIRSVIAHIGSGFWRLRLGVGHPGKREAVIGHVLKRARGEDEEAIIESIERSIGVLATWVEEGPERAVQALHTKDRAAAPSNKD